MIYLSFTEYRRKGNYEGFKYSIFDLESVILVGPFQLLSKKKKNETLCSSPLCSSPWVFLGNNSLKDRRLKLLKLGINGWFLQRNKVPLKHKTKLVLCNLFMNEIKKKGNRKRSD